MTSQTKHFIELSDIVSLQLKCRNPNCNTSLLVGLDKAEGNLSSLLAIDNQVLAQCPGCGREWMGGGPQGGMTFESEIKKMLRQMSDVKRLDQHFGCSMTFEIKADSKA
jgi:hypothetical protein